MTRQYKTGLECLREEMLRHGCTKAQTESKTVMVVLEIVANGGHIYTDLAAAETRLELVQQELKENEQRIRKCRAELQALNDETLEACARVVKKQKKQKEYLQELEERLLKLETPEARDALRTAQAFTNMANVKTENQSIAYICGLALILSGRTLDGKPLKPIEIDEPKEFYIEHPEFITTPII